MDPSGGVHLLPLGHMEPSAFTTSSLRAVFRTEMNKQTPKGSPGREVLPGAHFAKASPHISVYMFYPLERQSAPFALQTLHGKDRVSDCPVTHPRRLGRWGLGVDRLGVSAAKRGRTAPQRLVLLRMSAWGQSGQALWLTF